MEIHGLGTILQCLLLKCHFFFLLWALMLAGGFGGVAVLDRLFSLWKCSVGNQGWGSGWSTEAISIVFLGSSELSRCSRWKTKAFFLIFWDLSIANSDHFQYNDYIYFAASVVATVEVKGYKGGKNKKPQHFLPVMGVPLHHDKFYVGVVPEMS